MCHGVGEDSRNKILRSCYNLSLFVGHDFMENVPIRAAAETGLCTKLQLSNSLTQNPSIADSNGAFCTVTK